MKTHWKFKVASVLACICLTVGAGTAIAGTSTGKSTVNPTEPVSLDELTLDESYVFSSPIQFAGKKVGNGDELHSSFDYLRRFPIKGSWYFQTGITYERFDFGGRISSPMGTLPDTLQTANIPIGVAYIVEDRAGFLLQVRPGVNFEHDVNTGGFDIPVEIGGYIPIKKDKFYIVYGLGTSILRQYPAIPTVGILWVINDDLQLYGYAPEPKLVYNVRDNLTVWIGGEVLEGSFRTDSGSAPASGKSINGTVVDYSEYRAGLGVTYTPVENWDINFAAGYTLERDFDFYRAHKEYAADPAPYVRFQLNAQF